MTSEKLGCCRRRLSISRSATMIRRVRPLLHARWARTVPSLSLKRAGGSRTTAPLALHTPLCLMSTEAGPSTPAAQDAERPTEPTRGESDDKQRTDLLESYRELVSSGRLKWDDEQVRVVMKVSRKWRSNYGEGALLTSATTSDQGSGGVRAANGATCQTWANTSSSSKAKLVARSWRPCRIRRDGEGACARPRHDW